MTMTKNSLLLFGTSSGLQPKAKDNSEPAPYKSGFTLIELLIVLAILIVLILLGWFSWQNQVNKARDAQRKDHLERLSVAFEDYYNDHDCYPDSGIIDICQGNQLEPYLYGIPCDPVYNTPYCYIHDPDALDCGQNFKILSPLDNTTDPIITKLLCHGEEGCGYNPTCESATGTTASFDYGVGSGNVPILNPDTSPPPVPSSQPATSPTPPPGEYTGPGQYGCQSWTCNNYGSQANAEAHCPLAFSNENCDNLCAEPSYQCSDWYN